MIYTYLEWGQWVVWRQARSFFCQKVSLWAPRLTIWFFWRKKRAPNYCFNQHKLERKKTPTVKHGALACGSDGKESACNIGDLGLILHWEDPLENGTAIHSSIFAWRIPWSEELSGLQSTGSQRVRHNWETFTFTFQTKLREKTPTVKHGAVACAVTTADPLRARCFLRILSTLRYVSSMTVLRGRYYHPFYS